MLKLIKKVKDNEIRLLAKWRRKVQPIWHETFKVTLSGTSKWLQGIISNPNKALYFVIKDGKKIGHIGFYVMDGEFYVDNVIRGEGKPDGTMTREVNKFINLTPISYVLVYPDNKRAIEFYKKIGFIPHEIKGKYLKMKHENKR